jgi:3-methyladenine DNA glycosylase AlkD
MPETTAAVLHELESLGTEQNRKIYQRHGVGEDQYGVSYANLGRLKKRITVDHDLALALWASGNHDARVLATMVADPRRADSALLDAWVSDLTNYVITDAFTDLAARTPYAREKAEAWLRSEDEWTGRAGWHVLARLAGTPGALTDEEVAPYIPVIEREIHTRKNRVRDAMNNALIAIGGRGGDLEAEALAAAARIGVVEVDHGETNCKTPDAAAYIRRMGERQRAKQPAGSPA